jgi:hypothetical protein
MDENWLVKRKHASQARTRAGSPIIIIIRIEKKTEYSGSKMFKLCDKHPIYTFRKCLRNKLQRR